LDSEGPWLPSVRRYQKGTALKASSEHIFTHLTANQTFAHAKLALKQGRNGPVVMLSLSSSGGRTSVCRNRARATSCMPKLRTGYVSRNSETAVKLARPFSWFCNSSMTYNTYISNAQPRISCQ